MGEKVSRAFSPIGFKDDRNFHHRGFSNLLPWAFGGRTGREEGVGGREEDRGEDGGGGGGGSWDGGIEGGGWMEGGEEDRGG